MDIHQATEAYEAWLGKRLALISADMELKHQRMAESPFPFLRATFYRWVQRWPEVCPELAAAPAVLSVGDLHIENFGTWRDAEGRLIWGINDFDEAYPMPYTNDLVRLADQRDPGGPGKPSVCSIPRMRAMRSWRATARRSIKAAARSCWPSGIGWLRDLAYGNLHDPAAFWDKLDKLPAATEAIDPEVIAALERWLPEKGLAYKLVHRVAGLGSLGRQRFVALADWRGGLIAREAKALTVSACLWEKRAAEAGEILYEKILGTSVRVLDPWVQLAARGSSAAWPPIAAASSWRPSRRTATSRSSCTRWARRQPTSTRATVKQRPRSGPTCRSGTPTG